MGLQSVDQDPVTKGWQSAGETEGCSPEMGMLNAWGGTEALPPLCRGPQQIPMELCTRGNEYMMDSCMQPRTCKAGSQTLTFSLGRGGNRNPTASNVT